MLGLLLIERVTKMKLGSNSVEGHPQLSHNRHPLDGALVGAGSLWPTQYSTSHRKSTETGIDKFTNTRAHAPENHPLVPQHISI
jgi:hypothetical protein